MKFFRQLAIPLFVCAWLGVPVATGSTNSCLTPRGHILAKLASPAAEWNPEEVTRLTEYANLSRSEFMERIETMPPLERFRLAASFLLATGKHSHLAYEFDLEVREKMAGHANWLWFHLLKDLTPAERLKIVQNQKAFAEPFRGAERSLYKSAQEHWRYEMSLVLDRVYGLDIDREEQRVPMEMKHTRGMKSAAGEADWSLRRLNANSQNTTYADMEAFFAAAQLEPGQTVVDLGASYGRIGMFIAARHPGVKFKGYEINPDRVAAGKKIFANLGFKEAELLEQDLSAPDFVLPPAEVYYMYDPVNSITREILFKKIKERAAEAKRDGKKIKVICREGRGDFHQWMEQQTWLKPTQKITSIARRGWGTDDSIIFESE